jgi:hypothetical protein
MKRNLFNTIIKKNGKTYFCRVRKARNIKNEFHYSIKINSLDGFIMIAGFCGGIANNSPIQVKRGFPVIETKEQAIKYIETIL